MNIKRGSVVSHSAAKEWGVGKVTEVNDLRAVIRFSDGVIRKIISSHFSKLEKADPAEYLSADDAPSPVVTKSGAAKKAKATKTVKVE